MTTTEERRAELAAAARRNGASGGAGARSGHADVATGRRHVADPRAGEPAEADWYKDAIIYEVPVRAFCDCDGDGRGDLRGLTSRLDYLQQLGVTALWLLPFYPSPLRDDGYDIADYTAIHPDLGTLADFRNFVEEAHRRGLRVITELVLNHTSDQHAWFQRSRRAPRGSYWRNFYVWSDDAGPVPRRPDHLQGLRALQLDLGSRRRGSTSGTASTPTSRTSTSSTRRCAGGCCARSTSGSASAWTGCASTPCPTSTSRTAPTARTSRRRTAS